MLRNTLLAFLLLVGLAPAVSAQSGTESYRYRLMLAGASFSTPANSWFEIGCRRLNALPVNKGVGGGSIVNLANDMGAGTFYSLAGLDSIDAFVIMHVHERDVFSGSKMQDKPEDYRLPFQPDDYAEAFDYAIKKYTSDCYNQKFNPDSRYYGKPFGKPALIVLTTHWHDARTTYNATVRQLADKWGLPLVEFDKYIGFSHHQLHPVTQDQYSLIFAQDTQVIRGVKHGWHPIRGEASYIQQKMAAIFADLMQRVLPLY